MDTEMILKLKANDGKVVEISNKAASRSKVLKEMMNDYPEASEIPLNEVDGPTLFKVVDYLSKYKDEEPRIVEKPLKSNDLKEVLQNDWEYNFLNIKNDAIISLMKASNFLDIKPLLELIAVKIACDIRGTTTESIVKCFNLKKFNKEEEQNIIDMKAQLEKSL